MYCRKCGKQIPDDSVFCPACGQEVKKVVIDTEKPVESIPTDNEKPQKEIQVELKEISDSSQSNTKSPLMIIGILIVVLIVVGVLLNVVSGILVKDSSKEEEKTEEKVKEDTKEEEETKEETSKTDKTSSTKTEETTEQTTQTEQPVEQQQTVTNNTSSDYIIADSSSRIISESELYNLTQDQCCFARNEIYARHGRLFNTEYIQAYFNTKSWYSGTIAPESFTADMLNEVETQNVATILNYEKRMGWQ